MDSNTLFRVVNAQISDLRRSGTPEQGVSYIVLRWLGSLRTHGVATDEAIEGCRQLICESYPELGEHWGLCNDLPETSDADA